MSMHVLVALGKRTPHPAGIVRRGRSSRRTFHRGPRAPARLPNRTQSVDTLAKTMLISLLVYKLKEDLTTN